MQCSLHGWLARDEVCAEEEEFPAKEPLATNDVSDIIKQFQLIH